MDWLKGWGDFECVDLSVPLSPEFPINWPTLPPFRKNLVSWFEDFDLPNGARVLHHGNYYAQSLVMDEHTGTHVDFPLHVLPPQELNKSGVEISPPLSTFAGPAVVIDARFYLDKAPPGRSPRLPIGLLEDWEARHGSIQAGEVVLFNTGYMDKHFAAFPEGNRLVRIPLFDGSVPGWPVPSDQVFELLATRGVRHLGIDSPSIGALDNPSGPHHAGVKLRITYAECLIHLDQLPPRGAPLHRISSADHSSERFSHSCCDLQALETRRECFVLN